MFNLIFGSPFNTARLMIRHLASAQLKNLGSLKQSRMAIKLLITWFFAVDKTQKGGHGLNVRELFTTANMESTP